MRHLTLTLGAAGLLLSGLPAAAQSFARGDDRYAADRDFDHTRLIDRVHSDLDRVEVRTLPLTPDRIRVEKAQEKVIAFKREMNAGDDQQRYLDDAVAALQKVADDNRNLTDDDRDHLAGDLSRLRDYQAWLDHRE